jgi:hypothetical protein
MSNASKKREKGKNNENNAYNEKRIMKINEN